MQNVQRTAGKSYETLTVGDRKIKLRPLKVGIYADLEAYVFEMRGDPLEAAGAAVAKLPAQLHPAIWEAAFRVVMTNRAVSTAEISAFETSVRGIAWKLWKCVETDQPEIDSLEKALELLTEIGPARAAEVELKLKVASGEADLGKSTGPMEAEVAPLPDGH